MQYVHYPAFPDNAVRMTVRSVMRQQMVVFVPGTPCGHVGTFHSNPTRR